MHTTRKCIVWDLDDTLWDGVCLEGPVVVKPEIADAVAELDRRGILHSIASRGDTDQALHTLKQFGLEDYFLVPKINWLPKWQNITAIARELSISLDAMAFVDDDQFEREQVAFMLPHVLTIPATSATEIPNNPVFTPREITEEAKSRRQLYRAEIGRRQAEESFSSREEFLLSCGMRLTVRPMEDRDISRVIELMTRTHQLNTTGLMMERAALVDLLRSNGDHHRIYVAELRDKFGGYGIIGSALVELSSSLWTLKQFALSCRVMGRGIERAFLSRLVHGPFGGQEATIVAEFRDTGRNRMMRAMYQMMGFRASIADDSGVWRFCAESRNVPEGPSWIEIT